MFKYTLLFALLFSGACSLVTNFDEEEANNNTSNNAQNNANNTHNSNNLNNTGPEICDNGMDEDGDGFIDCDDEDCYENEFCECRLDRAFFDSHDTCHFGETCVLKPTTDGLEPACVGEDRIDDGIFYGPCGAAGECPFGSYCVTSMFSGGNICQPWCSPSHDWCPEGGSCSYFEFEEPDPEEIRTCIHTDGCFPPDPNSCPESLSCYLIAEDGGSSCLPSGNTLPLTTCTSYTECRPGHVCLGADDGEGTCLKWCDVNAQSPCYTLGTLYSCMELAAGIGVCVK